MMCSALGATVQGKGGPPQMYLTGLLLIILGGVMEGLFSLPTKITPKWSWENIWGAGSLAALALVPWPLLYLTVPHIGSVYSASPNSAIVAAILYGAGWGLGGLFFGFGVSYLGIAMGTSLIMGLIAIGGSVVPLLLQHQDKVETKSLPSLLAGIAIMLVGQGLCAQAGMLKGPSGSRVEATRSTSPLAIGILFCVAAGVLSALVNFALIFGAPIAKPAMAQGLDLATANNAVWALVFTSGYLVNLCYCIFKCLKEKTFYKFLMAGTGRYWIIAGMMGLVWAGGIIIYGRGASMEGASGPVFGFPIMLIVAILTGNAAGAAMGEWRGAPSKAKRTMTLGVVVMVLAIVVLGYARYA